MVAASVSTSTFSSRDRPNLGFIVLPEPKGKCGNTFRLPEVTWFNTNDKVMLETIGLATGRLQSQPLFFTVYFSNLVVVSDNSVGTKLTLCLSKHRLKLSYISSDSRLILNI